MSSSNFQEFEFPCPSMAPEDTCPVLYHTYPKSVVLATLRTLKQTLWGRGVTVSLRSGCLGDGCVSVFFRHPPCPQSVPGRAAQHSHTLFLPWVPDLSVVSNRQPSERKAQGFQSKGWSLVAKRKNLPIIQFPQWFELWASLELYISSWFNPERSCIRCDNFCLLCLCSLWWMKYQ